MAVCGVVPVAAIVPVWLAGEYQHIRGNPIINTVLQVSLLHADRYLGVIFMEKNISCLRRRAEKKKMLDDFVSECDVVFL